MDLLLILTYTAFCVALFKLFRIPLNKWTVPTAVLGGVVLIGGLIFTMNYNHPYSEVARSYYITTPIVPVVSGDVVEVPVKGNQALNKGDVLFRMDPSTFQNQVHSLQAQLAAVRADLGRSNELFKRNVGNRRDVDVLNAKVIDLTAQLATAEYNLEHTVVRAPSQGYVTQVSLRPGMRVSNLPLRPPMVFIPDESHYLVAWMRQNSQLRLTEGDEAEVAFDGIPGQVFKGRVKQVIAVIGEGQVQPSGTLISYSSSAPPGRVPVFIEITDPAYEQYRLQMPGGSYGQAAIYTEHFHHVAVMRKILLRMAAWMNYIFPFH